MPTMPARLTVDFRTRASILRTGVGACCLSLIFGVPAAAAQELAPRAYWPTPVGTKAVAFAYQFSAGDVLMDPSLPVTGVDSSINATQFTYQQTFSLSGRTTTLQFGLPYSWGTTTGFLEGEFRSRSLSAFADTRFRLSVNVRGAPAMDSAAFQELRAAPRTLVGVSLLVQAPTGKYESARLLNVGTHRWGFKPALGVVWPLRPTWLLEAEFGVWFFSDNDEFLGFTRSQAPILSTEFHLIKRIRPGFWASVDANFYRGGNTTIDGDLRADLQRNSRIGGTLSFPFKRQHAVRFSFSTGVVTTSGGDFERFTASYFYAWK